MIQFFSYGTLRNPHIQAVTGGKMKGTADTLEGYKKTEVIDKGEKYPNIVPEKGSSVDGDVYDVTETHWKKILDWEEDYTVEEVTLKSGKPASVFILEEKDEKSTEEPAMGSQAIKIVDGDADKIVKLLNQAFASEWLAYYQYWLGAQIASGPLKGEVIAELSSHADEELGHAKLLSDRIIILGGTPVLNPKSWFELSPCEFLDPDDDYVLELVRQNLKGERCAIAAYNKLMNVVKDIDSVTFEMVVDILADEEQHEEDLQRLEEDFKLMATRAMSYKEGDQK